jgi:hypothetical protein
MNPQTENRPQTATEAGADHAASDRKPQPHRTEEPQEARPGQTPHTPESRKTWTIQDYRAARLARYEAEKNDPEAQALRAAREARRKRERLCEDCAREANLPSGHCPLTAGLATAWKYLVRKTLSEARYRVRETISAGRTRP